MATDPITGLSLDQPQQALDYLGRQAPLGLAQQAALPGGRGGSPSAGPASAGGTGVAGPSFGPEATPAAAGGQVSAGVGQNTFSTGAPSLAEQIAIPAIGAAGGQLKNFAQNLIPSPSPPPFIDPAVIDPSIVSGVSGGSTYLGSGAQVPFQIPSDILGGASGGARLPSGLAPAAQVSGGELGLGAESGLGGLAGETGASLGAGSILGAYGGLSAVYDLAKLAGSLMGGGKMGGPTTGNKWGDLGLSFLGGPVGDVAKATVGKFLEPSSAWQNFGPNLASTLGGESSAINTLVPWLGKAQTRGDIDQSLDLFRQLVETGSGVGGYQLGGRTASGAPQVGLLPGATGSRHEGGLTADFGPVTAALNDYISKLYAVLPEGQASAPLSYEAYAAGMGQPQYDQMQSLVQQVVGLAPDQAQAVVAQSGLDPAMQQKILQVAESQANMTPGINRGGPDPYQESLRLAGMQ